MSLRSASEDTEITLGTGKLLGLFFLLAAVCGMFFAIGYSLGKNSAREQALNDQAAAASREATAAPAEVGKKPSAIVALKQQPTEDRSGSTNRADDLTFYKSVQQGQANAKLTQAAVPQAASTTKGEEATASEPQASPKPAAVPAAIEASTTPSSPATEAAHTTSGIDRGAYMVQIAAVTRQEDAQALADALKKKSYSVFVVSNPGGTDKLFHVQVGPFASLPDAEAMKSRLTSEGYNPIVKR